MLILLILLKDTARIHTQCVMLTLKVFGKHESNQIFNIWGITKGNTLKYILTANLNIVYIHSISNLID